ncbi:MAG: hypothetical protein HN350_02555 [Phycisphaerales bacterium]|jgi:hypothetical protein|nr:hypothetical protein [Phycisphaerales bacterium]
MNNERRRILEMLARGDINVNEADKLLARATETMPARKRPRYLYVLIEKANESKDKVNLRIPIKLLAHGLKLTKLLPPEVREKINLALMKVGMSFQITEDNIMDLVDALTDISVEIAGGETVQIYCR